MRYDNGTDWVEINGAARKTMRTLTGLDTGGMTEAHDLALSVTTDAHFENVEDGSVCDWRGDVLTLSAQQWTWWKGRIWAAARDEKLDPEA